MANRKPLVQVAGEVQEIADADTLSVKSLKLSDDVQIGSIGNTDWLYLGEMAVTGGGQSHRLNIKLYGGDWTDAGEIGYKINSFGQTSLSTAISIRRVYSFWYTAAGEIYNNVEFKVFRNDSTQKIETYVRMTAVDFVSLYAEVVHTDTTGAELTFSAATATLPTTGYTELTVTVGEMPTVQNSSGLFLRNTSLSRSTLYDFSDPTQVSIVTFDGTNIQLLDKLRLAASTTTRAQLRLDSGVAPSAPGSGDLWNEGPYIKYQNNTGTRYLTLTAGMTTTAIPKASGAGILVDSLLIDTGTEIRQASGLYRIYNTSLTSFALAFTGGTAAIPDANSAFVMRMDGLMEWGAGGGSGRDTSLYRSAANVLKTDDNFDVGIDLRVAGTPRITAGGAGTFATVSAANLTLDRLVTVGASGLLTDDGGLYTVKTSGVTRTLTIGSGAAAGVPIQILMDGVAGQSKIIRARTGSVHRWGIGANADAESGTSAGSNFVVEAYNDAGGLIDNPIYITRASLGQILLGGTNRDVVINAGSKLLFGGTGNLGFRRSGDGYAVHFFTGNSGTDALLPDTTTAGNNPSLGNGSYRWNGVYSNAGYFTGTVNAANVALTDLTPGRVTYVGAGDVITDDSALLFDSVKKDFGIGVDRTIVGSTVAVAEAAEVLIASGSYANGLYELRFDHTNRVERLWVRINAQSYNDQPIITVVQYFSYNNAKCFGTIRVRRSADSSQMYITVTVSNLNGGTGGINVVAKLLDAAAPTGFTIGGTLPGSTVSLRSLVPDDVVGYKSSSGADFAGAVVAQTGVTAWGTTTVPGYWNIGQGTFDAARVAFGTKASGDAYGRMLIKEDGLLEWGSGAAARDTNLYRALAGMLKTDDVFMAANGYRATGYDVTPLASTGPGVEVHYDTANTRARLLGYDRTAAARIELAVDGSPINFYANGIIKGSFNAAGDFNVLNLTSGRMLYTGASGVLTVSAKLLYAGGDTLTLGNGTADASFILNKSDAGTGAIRFQAAGVERGSIGFDSSENFFLESKTAAGAVIDQPLTWINSAGGAMTIVRPLTLTQALSGTSGTFSSLTSGRVTFAGASGLLSDNASLTFNAATTRFLTVGSNIAQHAYVDISAGTGFNSALRLYANNVLRWRPGLNSSVGYEILALDAAGASIDNPVSIVNASAGTITLGGTTLRTVALTGALTVAGTGTVTGLLTASAGLDVGTSSQSWIRNGGGGLYMGYGSSKTDYRFYCYGDTVGMASMSAGSHVAGFQATTVGGGGDGIAIVQGDKLKVEYMVGTDTRPMAVDQFGYLVAQDAATFRTTIGAAAALGYTPINKAGDTGIGALSLSSTLTVSTLSNATSRVVVASSSGLLSTPALTTTQDILNIAKTSLSYATISTSSSPTWTLGLTGKLDLYINCSTTPQVLSLYDSSTSNLIGTISLTATYNKVEIVSIGSVNAYWVILNGTPSLLVGSGVNTYSVLFRVDTGSAYVHRHDVTYNNAA